MTICYTKSVLDIVWQIQQIAEHLSQWSIVVLQQENLWRPESIFHTDRHYKRHTQLLTGHLK